MAAGSGVCWRGGLADAGLHILCIHSRRHCDSQKGVQESNIWGRARRTTDAPNHGSPFRIFRATRNPPQPRVQINSSYPCRPGNKERSLRRFFPSTTKGFPAATIPDPNIPSCLFIPLPEKAALEGPDDQDTIRGEPKVSMFGVVLLYFEVFSSSVRESDVQTVHKSPRHFHL